MHWCGLTSLLYPSYFCSIQAVTHGGILGSSVYILNFTTYYTLAPVRIFHGLGEVCALESNQSATRSTGTDTPSSSTAWHLQFGSSFKGTPFNTFNGHLFNACYLEVNTSNSFGINKFLNPTHRWYWHRHTAGLQLLITINALHGFSTPSEITVIPELLCNYLSFRLISVLLTLLSLVTLPPHFYL